MRPEINIVFEALQSCWIKETSKQPEKWTKTNPSLGQCAITSVIVKEMFGGIIIRGEMKNGQTHYWNIVGNDIVDLTRDQYKHELSFERISLVNEDKILSNEDTAKRLDILKKKLKKELEESSSVTPKEKKARTVKAKEVEA